jgi:ubiquinone/menaquinone biosynthesis C-methylase UbiE
MERLNHWENVYGRKEANEVSWFAPHLSRSLAMIHSVTPNTGRILDVGGGASTLVDDLLNGGFRQLSVMDISAASLRIAQERLGAAATQVQWITSDVTRAELPAEHYDVWHDRAVFHFLTTAADRQAYAELARHSVKTGGHLIVATFAIDGPARCSGLDVIRYDGDSLAKELPGFVLQEEVKEEHVTPAGGIQRFVYCRLRKV